MRLILLYAAAAGLLFAQNRDPISTAMWSNFQGTTWQESLAQWQSGHPDLKCKSHEDSGNLPDALEDYCRQCPADREGTASSAFFFAFDPDKPVCELLQFETNSPQESPQDTSRIYNDLRALLARNLGPGAEAGDVHGYCAAYWRNARLWQGSEFQVLLFVNECQGKRTVELLAQHRKLLAVKAEDDRIANIRFQSSPGRERTFYASLADRLKTGFPELPALAAATDWQKLDYGSVLANLRALVSSPANGDRPMHLLMADRLADMLGEQWKPPYNRRQLKIGDSVLTYAYDHLADGWIYDHALLRRVAQAYGNTEWGQWAFLWLQDKGGFTGAGCPSDPALFRSVIAQVEPYLQRNPNARYRLNLMFDLAQAYDTWWSASQASPTDDYVTAANYTRSSDNARQRAVEIYERIRREAPNSDFAIIAVRALPRLKLSMDTGERRYYCIYD